MRRLPRAPLPSVVAPRQAPSWCSNIRNLHTTRIMAGSSTSAALYAAVSSGVKQAAPTEAGHLRHHVKGGKGYTNPWDSYRDMSAPQIIRAMAWHTISGKSRTPDTTPPTVLVRKPEFLPSRQTDTLRATWLGHACYYVEFPGGLRVLFDPVFTERCSPFSWIGPKRYTDMPCQIEDIPIIDAVVISHNHYDHLSHPTITKIQNLHPNVHFFAPVGNKQWFSKCGIENMTELDWWESRDLTLSPSKATENSSAKSSVLQSDTENATSAVKGSEISAKIGCLPCQHTSARGPFDKAHTLWGSWSVESGGKKVYFGGDTGYRTVPELPNDVDDYDSKYDFPTCPAFKEIGELRGPFDLGIIPIGAYMPRWIMSPMHANPFDSVNIFLDTKCKRAMGIHWGTWVLTEEDVLEPPRLLKQALARKNIAEEGVFDVCEIGESREFNDDAVDPTSNSSKL